MPTYRERLDALLGGNSTQPTPSTNASGLPQVTVGGSDFLIMPGHGGVHLQPIQPTIDQKVADATKLATAKSNAATEDPTMLLQHYLQVIKEATKQLPTSENPVISTVSGHLQNAGQTMFPNFRRAVGEIEAAKVPFMKAVADIKKGSGLRITQAELTQIPKLISDLPYLPPTEQQKNLQAIDDLLQKAGVPSGGTPSTDSLPLPTGVKLAPGIHQDAQGRKILVNPDGTYQPQ